ncbi:hypothetical protein JXJ21_15220 [candidate division KSB1 bacterium]|nr:hypothetical protein [candidate division KSB1 bacterium]
MKQGILICVLLVLFSGGLLGKNLIAEADSIYELRGENFNKQTLLADVTNIDEVIALCQKAIQTSTGAEKEDATWKLMRAYYFKGRYTTHDSEQKKKIYDLGKEVGEKGLEEFPESAGIHLFMAIIWGVWGEEYGIFKAAKEGVAKKIRAHCEKTIELDEMFDEAGGYRVYGRLHFKAPKIPFILGWPSNDEAIKLLEKGHELAPRNLVTRQFLAEALEKDKQKERAIKLMKEILATKEIVEGVVEDTVLKDEVAATLQKWEKD